ncbi:MAG: outer membrane protein, partial [Myxococcaceae bacterium]|nr:outer membrane protein [Myxococcaceae bacterium]
RADPPAPTVRLDLAECLARAERSYPGLRAARHKIAASDAQLDEAWVAPFFPMSVTGFMSLAPTARGNSTYSPDVFAQNPLVSETGVLARLNVDTGVPISPWTWIRLGHVRDAARAGVRANRGEQARARLELRANVRKAFFGLQSSRDALFLIERAEGYIRTAREQLAEARTQDGGAAPGANDEAQLEMAAEELVVQRATATRLNRLAHAALGLLTGVGEAVDVPDEPLCPYRVELGPLSRHLTRARLERPEVDMVAAGVAARRAAVSIQQYAYLPDLALGLVAAVSTATTMADQPNPFSANNNNYAYWGGGLALRWTFDPLVNRQRVRRLSEELAMTQAQQELALGGIALEVTGAYERAREQQIVEAARGRQERWGFQWFTAVFTQFQSGAVEIGDILSPLRQYLGARAAHIQSINDLNTQLAELAKETGQAELDGAPGDDCRAPAVEPATPGATEDAGTGGASEEDIEAILRASQPAPSTPAVDAGVARPAARDGGIARPR